MVAEASPLVGVVASLGSTVPVIRPGPRKYHLSSKYATGESEHLW
jgi:hypothetical protein